MTVTLLTPPTTAPPASTALSDIREARAQVANLCQMWLEGRVVLGIISLVTALMLAGHSLRAALVCGSAAVLLQVLTWDVGRRRVTRLAHGYLAALDADESARSRELARLGERTRRVPTTMLLLLMLLAVPSMLVVALTPLALSLHAL